jgi:hypothetical protein
MSSRNDAGHLGLTVSSNLGRYFYDKWLTNSFSGSFCILQSICIMSSLALLTNASTHVQRDMSVVGLDGQLDLAGRGLDKPP